MMTSSSSCIAPITPMQSILLGVLVPFVVFGELFVMFVVHSLLWLCWRRRDPHKFLCAKFFGIISSLTPTKTTYVLCQPVCMSIGQRTMQKSPYLRTATSLFLFSC
jgi:hypothetical protein